jgi:hypothetical protein
MASLPRPLLALLVVVAAFFAAWMVVLKPHSSSSGGASPQAIHDAVSKATGASHAATTAKHAASAPAAKAGAHHRTTPARAHVSAAQRRVDQVTKALESGKVLALLFYNPSAADDVADTKALAEIPSRHGQVVKVAVPVAELARYTEIVDHVPVQSTPSLLVINRHHAAQMLVGFADPLEYDQLVAGALRTK